MENRPSDDRKHFAETQADAFDRAYGQALGFPKTRESVVTEANILGVGGVRQYTVQTFRITQGAATGDQAFIWINGPEGLSRVWLPAKVTAPTADALLSGLKLTGFAVWERRTGGGRTVTFPARQYSVNGERRSFALLRPIADVNAQEFVRQTILDAYAEYEKTLDIQ